MITSFIPCPIPGCTGKIPFSLHQLLLGGSFGCPKCKCDVSLSVGSVPIVQTALIQYEQLIQQSKAMKDASMI